MIISLKANNQSCGPPLAPKMYMHLVIVKALKGLNNPCGAPSASKTLSRFVEPG